MFASLLLFSCSQTPDNFLADLDPGRYDTTWWNRAPIRLIQTNLPENRALMNVDAYVQSMVDASANAVLINVGGIVANYPTMLENHFRNPYLQGDLVGDLVSKLHEKGIKVFGRFDFSKVNESIAANNPGWLYSGTDGKNVNYNGQVHTCINGGYQQEYAFEILKEAVSAYPLDGVFFNMIGYTTTDYSGINHGICQCENCKKRFLDSTGFRLPVRLDTNDPVAKAYRAFRVSTSEELFNRIREHIKSLDPDIVINTYTDAGVDLISSESGSSLRDEYEWNYSATGNVKQILGSYKDRISCNLLICFQAIGYRHIVTSPNIARVWMLENMLHGAPVTYVVIGTLADYEDRVFFPVLNDLFGFHKTHEKLFTNIQSVSKLGLIRGSWPEYQGLIKLLSEEHIMYDVLEPSAIGSARAPLSIEDYDVLIIGDLRNLDDDQAEIIDDYVRNGGKLLTTGFTSVNDEKGGQRNSLGLRSLGTEPGFEVYQQSPSTYLKVSDDDKMILGPEDFRDFEMMMMYSGFLKCKPASGAKGCLRLIPQTVFGPPEKCYYTESEITAFPGVIINTYGKGKSVFIPWELGSQYNFKGNYAHRALFEASLMNQLDFKSSIETDASPLVEMSHLNNLNGAFEWIGMINHSGQIGGSFREPVTMHNINVRFQPAKPVKQIRLLRSGKSTGFRQNDGWIDCVVPQLTDFEMILCTYK